MAVCIQKLRGIPLPITRQGYRPADLPTEPSSRLDALFHPGALPLLLRHPVGQTEVGGTGFSTRCPSPTPFGLNLGPDLPWVDDPSPGNLRLAADQILTDLFATHTGILTPWRSSNSSKSPSPPQGRSPTTSCDIQSFGVMFSPVTFSAQRHSTSELLRTLSMVAASKPTSWLSVQRHNVSH